MENEELLRQILAPNTYSEAGRGRKQCPSCNTYVGVRNYFCVCGHEFIAGETSVKKEPPYDEATMRFAAAMGVQRGHICYTPSNIDRLNTKLVELNQNGVIGYCDDVIDEYLNLTDNLLHVDGLKYLGRYHLNLTGDDLQFFDVCVNEWFSNLSVELEA